MVMDLGGGKRGGRGQKREVERGRAGGNGRYE